MKVSTWDRAAWLAIAIAAVGVGVLVVASISFMGSRGYGYDFGAYDAAARRVVDGVALYIPDTARRYAEGAYEGLYLYPPPMAIALVPLTVLAPDGATFAWFIGRILALTLGCAILPVAVHVRLALFGVACLSYPVLFDLNLGNVSVVTFALTALAWRAAGSWLAAVAHAVLVAIRFTFGLYFLMWAARADLRQIVMTTLAGSVLILVSLPIVGIGAYLDYVTILRDLPDISTGPHNLSLKSTVLALGGAESIAAAAVPIGAAFAAGATFAAARWRDDAFTIVLTAVATMLVSPFLHPHYLVLLLLPAALLADRGRPWGLLLPLAGWLPDPVLPVVPIATIVLLFTVLPSPSPPAPASQTAVRQGSP